MVALTSFISAPLSAYVCHECDLWYCRCRWIVYHGWWIPPWNNSSSPRRTLGLVGQCQRCWRIRYYQEDVGYVQALVFSIRFLVRQNYLRVRFLGPTDPPEYNWLYSIPAAVFTGGFLLAAQTGFAGLVQAGYLTSSILCISRRYFSCLGLSFTQSISTRFSYRTRLSVDRKTRQCPRHAWRWLWFRYVLGCRWVPTSRPCAIRYVGCCRRDGWFDHREEDYCHGASSDGRWLAVLSLESDGRRINFVACLYSLALRRRSCCRPYLYWKRVG